MDFLLTTLARTWSGTSLVGGPVYLRYYNDAVPATP